MNQNFASFMGLELIHDDSIRTQSIIFDKIEDIIPPSHMRRQDLWVMNYNKSPFLRWLSEEKLFEFGRKAMFILGCKFIKNHKYNVPDASETRKNLEYWTYFLEELKFRSIDLRKFEPIATEVRKKLFNNI